MNLPGVCNCRDGHENPGNAASLIGPLPPGPKMLALSVPSPHSSAAGEAGHQASVTPTAFTHHRYNLHRCHAEGSDRATTVASAFLAPGAVVGSGRAVEEPALSLPKGPLYREGSMPPNRCCAMTGDKRSKSTKWPRWDPYSTLRSSPRAAQVFGRRFRTPVRWQLFVVGGF